jgi:hypothetical protein
MLRKKIGVIGRTATLALLASAETRKLAAILAADVAGYSRLAGAEADACHAARVWRNRSRERHRISSVVDAITQGLSGLAVPIAPNKHVYERRLVRQLVVG